MCNEELILPKGCLAFTQLLGNDRSASVCLETLATRQSNGVIYEGGFGKCDNSFSEKCWRLKVLAQILGKARD